MKKKTVILQVLPKLVSGGVERGTIDMAKAISQAGYGSLVASQGGGMVAQLESSAATHITLPLASKNPFTLVLNAYRLAALIRMHQVDIIHARSRAPAWSAYWAAKMTGIHFVTTWHGTYGVKGQLKRFYNGVMGKGEVVIAVSEFIKDHIVQYYPVDKSKINVIHRGVEVDIFDPAKLTKERITHFAKIHNMHYDSPVVLLPGRMTEWKGHLFLLEALACIKDTPFHCVLVGKMDEHDHYQKHMNQRIKELGLTDRVHVIDQIKDMPALYALADVVVSASLRPEAFGRIAIEAQAMKRLLIATNHGGAKETVIPGKTGWLVEPGDVNALAQLLRDALNVDEQTRQQITSQARQHVVAHFSLDGMCRATLDVYRQVLGH